MQLSTLIVTALAAFSHHAAAAEAIAQAGYLLAAPAPGPTPPPQVGLARRDALSCASSLISKYGPPQPTGTLVDHVQSANRNALGHSCDVTYPYSDFSAIMSYATEYRDFLAKLSTLHASENCGAPVGFSVTGSCAEATYHFTANNSATAATITNPTNIPTKVIISGDAPAVRAGAAVAVPFVAAVFLAIM